MAILLIFLTCSTDFRGIWVPRWSLDDGREIFSHLDGRFNHVFLQIYALGQAYYPSKRAPSINSSGAWLKDFIDEAHRRHIKVSAWINVYYSWGYAPLTRDPMHPLNRQPNWYLADNTGRSILDYTVNELKDLGIEGYYLSPAHEHVREYLCWIAEEIVQMYDFDGIHLDYFRYPGSRFIYDNELRSKFMRKYCIDPFYFHADSTLPKRYSLWGCRDLETQWRQSISHDLTEYVRELSGRVKRWRSDLEVSVAVKPDYVDARYDYFQDWLTWVNAGYVDYVCLMLYSRNIASRLGKIREAVHQPGRVMVGLGLYVLSPAQIAEQVDFVEKSPFGGVVFFSYDQLKKDHAYGRALQ